MINNCILIGRMVRNAELRRTQQGDAVASFTLAVNRNYTTRDGQQQADFINCIVWKKQAENVDKYCSKGSLVGVEGRIQTRSYENNQGQRVNVVEVVCDSVQFLETKKENKSTNEQNSFDNQFNGYNISEDDIQF